MKYYGNENERRLNLVYTVEEWKLDSRTTEIGFLKNRGLLGEFIENIKNTRGVRNSGTIDITEMNNFEYNGVKYWYGSPKYGFSDTINFYEELPMVYNDNTFHWKKNKKYGSKECVIEDGYFEYFCIYKADETASIDVRYTECDNRHRNKVTIANIEVENATNHSIWEAITQWKKEFRKKIG